MKCVAVLVCAVAAASAVSFSRVVYEEWKMFKLEHQKRYDNELEELYRLKIYAENRRKVARHNQLFARGRVSYSQGLNEYSDLTHREFVTFMNGFNRTTIQTAAREPEERRAHYTPLANWNPPKEIDWRNEGAVTEVKNQKLCAACWAFSATGALEGQHFRRTRRLVSLSEQNLIDCSTNYNNNGCDGGKMKNAFNYIRDNKGIDTESSYPYEAMDDICRYISTDAGAKDDGYYQIPKDELQVMSAVAVLGPMAAAMCGSLESFRHYEAGVYYDKKCHADLSLDHAVLIVGYGSDDTGADYWVVKNSWGRSWGLDGYAKMARNRGNLCGIASDVSYPIV